MSGEPANTTYIYYSGLIQRPGYEELTRIIEGADRTKHCCLILATAGGDPDAAFRIGRALGHYYEQVTCFVPDICKSAGTLLAIAADELVIANTGELGPLDAQLPKPGEMFEQSSGLDLPSALERLGDVMMTSFRDFVMEIKVGGGISTRLATEVATDLTSALVNPMASQIDPLRLGENNRAMRIAHYYGERLNQKSDNLKPGAMPLLAGEYPHHGFVIDRKEAGELFNRVREPNTVESDIHARLKTPIAIQRWSDDFHVYISSDGFAYLEEYMQDNEQGDENADRNNENSSRIRQGETHKGPGGKNETRADGHLKTSQEAPGKADGHPETGQKTPGKTDGPLKRD